MFLEQWKTIIILLAILLFSECAEKQSEFTIWIGGAPQELDYWEKLIESFEESSGHHLILVRQPTYSDQRKQSLIVSLEAQQPNPDLFLMDVVWIEQFIRSGWLEPLNSYIQGSGFSTDPFFQSTINTVDRYRDQYYAFPVFVDVGLLYYRKDLLEKFNLGEPPATWNELIEYAQKIQKAQRSTNPAFNGYVWEGAQYEGLVCSFVQCLASNGGGIMDDGDIRVNREPNREALALLQNLIHQYHISPPNTYTEMKEEEVRQAFQRGNALFERNWTYAYKLHQQPDSPVRNRVGVTFMPHFKDHRPVSAIGGWHIGISAYSDVKAEAWEFLEFITSYEAQKNLMLNVGWTPGRRDVYQDEDIISQLPHIDILRQILEDPASRPTLPYYAQVSDVIQRFVNKCLANKMTPAEALENIQKELDQISRIYGEE